jgi:hypothetical protein
VLKKVQIAFAVMVLTATLIVCYGLQPSFSEETLRRGSVTVSLALIGLCGLLRLPFKLLVVLISTVFASTIFLSLNFFDSNQRVWVQEQIHVVCAIVLALLI